MDYIKINRKRYEVKTKAAELTLAQVKRLVNLKRPVDDTVEFSDYVREVLNICSGVSKDVLDKINNNMLAALFEYVSNIVVELETFEFQSYESVTNWFKYPAPVIVRGEAHYGHGIKAKTYIEASDIIATQNAATLALLPYVYSEIDDISAINSYQNEADKFIYAIAIDFFNVHMNITNTIYNQYPILLENSDSGNTIKGFGSKGLLYEVATSGIAPVNVLQEMDVIEFFDTLAYLRTVNKLINKR